MDRKVIISLFSFTLLNYFQECSADISQCTNINVQRCWKKPVDYLKSINLYSPDIDEFMLFHLTESQLRTYCNIYDKNTRKCLANLKSECPYNQRKLFEGEEDANEYFCDELEVFLRNRDCLGSSFVEDDIIKCLINANNKIGALPFAQSIDELKQSVCNIVYDYLDCEAEAAKSCGDEATKFVKTLGTHHWDPFMEQFDCSQDALNIAVAVGIMVPLLIIIIVTIVIVVFCCIKKGSRRSPRQQTQQAHHQPVVFNNVLTNNGLTASNPRYVQQQEVKGSGPPPSYPGSNYPEPAVLMTPPPYTSAPPSTTGNYYEGLNYYTSSQGGNNPQPQQQPPQPPQQRPQAPTLPTPSESNPVYIDPQASHRTITPQNDLAYQESEYAYPYEQPPK